MHVMNHERSFFCESILPGEKGDHPSMVRILNSDLGYVIFKFLQFHKMKWSNTMNVRLKLIFRILNKSHDNGLW